MAPKHSSTLILASTTGFPFYFVLISTILLITFKALNGLAPSQIKDSLKPYRPGRSLRSVNAALLADLTSPVRDLTRNLILFGARFKLFQSNYSLFIPWCFIMFCCLIWFALFLSAVDFSFQKSNVVVCIILLQNLGFFASRLQKGL